MPTKATPQAFGPPVNRIKDFILHLDIYAFKGVTRLAADARVSPSAVSRVLSGKTNPSALMLARIVSALERRSGRRIDARDLVAENGEFLTRFVCELAGCRGCLPEGARDEYGDLKPAFQGVKPGAWVCSKHPRGYGVGKGGE